MRLTTRGRYAVTALLDLALQAKGTPIALPDIAERQQISIAYLEQLFSKLKKAGLVTSLRGAGGGYLLAKCPEQIAISTIISAVDESLDATQCDGEANCNHGAMCLTHDLWNNLSQHIHQYLSGITLACLIENQHIQAVTLRHATPHLHPEHSPESIL